MTPDAERMLADPALAGDVRRCLARFFRWGAAPTIDAYCELFAPGGTLLDADMAEPISGDAIRESITRVLTLRYYDQAALLTGSDTFGTDPRAMPRGRDAAPAPLPGSIDVTVRATAWNRHDVGALLKPLGPVRLHMSGIAGVLEPTAAVAGALARFAVRSEGLAMTAGAVASDASGTAIEWVGRVGLGAAARRFAMVELLSPPTPGREWRLVFNTLGF